MMLKHVVLLLFLYGIKNGGTSSSLRQDQTLEAKEVFKNGIKKNEVGANGLEANLDKITRNFQNPVVEYLLKKNSDRSNPPQRGVVREIRHSQTLLVPSFLRSPLPELFIGRWPQFDLQKKPPEESIRNPDDAPFDNFWNFLKNKTQTGGDKIQESVVSSPVLHLNKNPGEIKEESTKIQVYPAAAVVINTFNKDGSLKSSVTHFQPDFNSLRHEANESKEATHTAEEKNENKSNKNLYNSQYSVSNYGEGSQSFFPGRNGHLQDTRQGISWPFANYFPIVINDPFLSVYNAFATSMYNAVSTMVEYGPDADVCLNKKDHESELGNREQNRNDLNEKKAFAFSNGSQKEGTKTDGSIFDEVTMRSDSIKKTFSVWGKKDSENLDSLGRKRRDTTAIFVKSREGDTVDITLEEPSGSNTDRKRTGRTDLILRKGGVAIAGPGGAATAYTGGTAIVGPYGTVYKSPEGTAILGPYSKIVNISDDTTFEEILKIHKEMQTQNPQPTPSSPEGGVEFKNYRNFFSYKTSLPIKFEVKPQAKDFVKSRAKVARLKEEDILKAIEEVKKAEFRRIVEDAPYERRLAKNNETTLIFRPKSKAEAGRNGVALSAPTSHAILFPGQKANVYFEPESVASAGPSGFAHAQSDLFLTYVSNDTSIPESKRLKRSMKTTFFKRLKKHQY